MTSSRKPEVLLLTMERALIRMDRQSRMIFLAPRLDGMDYTEIAVRVGITVRKVERHIADAIAILDRALSAAERDQPEQPWRRARIG
jgi:DNA-directed RNA polymerase specialized sigma24 family protein